ncbi:MAG: hypothetical protein UT24_C0016G0030 [Candidatus Woesebacteria bacterium GW2011_GWB1_39_12]|uniref:Uncharacterized protein n=1 Tax=Candidatus Woesebacteria bacterium GW2011_GWB1_39_12 TaxID=1618574 RepID=A0A0G0MIH2_9BACT|nr:MAG: hypothetical protein UT24_C0016G0030 [Candidatus Woesebacteria bacterium GW2011_GWB1_39_12]
MKAIHLKTIITSIRSKVDHSLGLSISTPELTVEESAEFMRLQGIECETLFDPLTTKEPPHEVKSEISQKTQSQRLRSVLFILWEQRGKKGTFEDFYRDRMEEIINAIKNKFDK